MSDNPNQQAAWLLERVGFVTASQFKHLLPGKKGGYLAARDTYKWQLITERLTGRATEHYVNPAMQWGIDRRALRVMHSPARPAWKWTLLALSSTRR